MLPRGVTTRLDPGAHVATIERKQSGAPENVWGIAGMKGASAPHSAPWSRNYGVTGAVV